MPSRRVPRPPPRRGTRPARSRPSSRSWSIGLAAVVALLGLLGLLFLAWSGWDRDRPRRLRDQAEAATRARDWPTALAAWRSLDRAGGQDGRGFLAEARAALALDRGADAARALQRATETDPTLAEAWRGRLDRLRVLDRPWEANRVGFAALAAVSPTERRAILASLTLALLAELPDESTRDRLDRWIAADPADLDARAARLARIAARPRPGDPDRAARIAELSGMLTLDPNHVPTREALTIALADAGDLDRGRSLLDAWPLAARDARYDRLRARWDLEFDNHPDRAAAAYQRALIDLPHDWKSHYGLARAHRALNHPAEAQAEALAVARLRERLDPTPLGPRLLQALSHLDDPQSRADLATLCAGAGLTRLAQAWTEQAHRDPAPAEH